MTTCNLHETIALKRQILEASLKSAGEKGWSMSVLEDAAREQGYAPAFVWALFPDGPLDAIMCWSRDLDQRMTEHLITLSLSEMKVRERIFVAVKTRLEVIEPFKQAAYQAALFLADMRYASKALCLTQETVNLMWRAAGDTSTDFNYYTKRMLLAPVYGRTLWHWFKDTSPDHRETWAFLKQKIEDTLKLGRLKHQVDEHIGRVQKFTRALLKTIRSTS